MSAASNMVRVDILDDDDPSLSAALGGSADERPAGLPADAEETSTSGSGQPHRASGGRRRAAATLPRQQLLCSLRSLFKKVNQTVLVGDRVRVGSIDWREARGQVRVMGVA